MPRVKVNGMEFYYEIHGTGEPVIFINGIFSTTESWINQVNALKNSYQVITYDCRDQGQTGFSSERYFFHQHIEDLNLFMEQIKVERAHLVGISYGATIANQFAYNYPNKVKKMVLISGYAEPDSKTLDTFLWLNQVFEIISLQDYYKIIMLLGTGPEFYNQIANFIPDFSEGFNQRFHGNKENPFRLIYAAVNGQQPDLERLKTVQAQVLIVAGELDSFVSPQCAVIMHNYYRNSELKIIPNCGHSVIIEKPDELNKMILDFIKK